MSRDFESLVGLLKQDNDRTTEVVRLLGSVTPDGVEILELGARSYGNLLRRLGKEALPTNPVVVSGGELPLGELLVLPLLISQRAYRLGATDLLRGRSTSAFGYLRQQVEAAALVRIMHDDHSLAPRWFQAVFAGGAEFFRQSQPRLKAAVREAGLMDAYERGSSESTHVRMAHVYRSYEFDRREHRGGVYLTLSDSDLSERTIGVFLRDVSYFMAGHVRTMHSFANTLMAHPTHDWRTELAIYALAVQKFEEAIRATFPAVVESER